MANITKAEYNALPIMAMQLGGLRFENNGRVAYINWDEDNAEFYVEFVGKGFDGDSEVYLTLDSDCPAEVAEEVEYQLSR